MAKKKNVDADDEGNYLPFLQPGQDVHRLIYLMEYARKRGFQVGPTVKIGELTVQIRDLRLSGDESAAPETDIWTEAGHREE